MQITIIPVMLIWLWFSLRARDLFFFSNANPLIKNGGVLGESKSKILSHLPDWIQPLTRIVDLNDYDFKSLKSLLIKEQLKYPIIIKPDVGERGFLVEKIIDDESLKNYLDRAPKTTYIVQEFIDYPLEVSVLYHRFPDNKNGKITSLCIKQPLEVEGDGQSTLAELINNYHRARFQKERLKKSFASQWNKTIPPGEVITLETIGNHCRGATFYNGNHLIDSQLEKVFDRISLKSEDLYYGRFDMKCHSLESLKKGGKFSVLEYNGVGGEPAHVYNPGYPMWKVYRDFYYHWNIIYHIHKSQKERGVETISFGEAWQDVTQYFSYKKWAGNHQ